VAEISHADGAKRVLSLPAARSHILKMIVIFSKDRAFQLEACLRTLLARCEDAADVPVRILWTASSSSHRQAYDILQETFKYKSSARVEFIEESSFRGDLVMILGNLARGSWRPRLVRRLLQAGSALWMQNFIPALIGLLLRPDPTVLFVVDDTLFLRSFNFARCSRLLLANEDCPAFSLRLGQGLTRFYMGDCDQEAPEMILVDKDSQVYQFRWTEAKGDFAYPLEISSSILNLNLILSRLLRKNWRSPNTLELALANMAGRYRKKHPLLLTFQHPRGVSAPLNIVQQDFTGNRHGGQERHRADALCSLFLKGVRADLSRLDQIKPASVHAEIDLLPTEE
jgi:hypothetical protein